MKTKRIKNAYLDIMFHEKFFPALGIQRLNTRQTMYEGNGSKKILNNFDGIF